MAQRALKGCLEPGCRELVATGRCDAHRRKRDRERGTARERGYTRTWESYRRAYLVAHPLCSECSRPERPVLATVVDHIIAHKGDSRLFWDPKNHRALCKACHDARVDEGDFGRHP